MCIRLRAMISSSCIPMTVETTLNQWFLWKKSFCTRAFKKCVFVNLTATMNISWNAVKQYGGLVALKWFKNLKFVHSIIRESHCYKFNFNQTSMVHLYLVIQFMHSPQQTFWWLSTFIVITCLSRLLADGNCL